MEQSLFADADSWAQANFGAVDLGRDDRRQRLLFCAARIAENPGASFPAIFGRKDLRDPEIDALKIVDRDLRGAVWERRRRGGGLSLLVRADYGQASQRHGSRIAARDAPDDRSYRLHVRSRGLLPVLRPR